MKAIVYSQYGGPDVLEYTEVDDPVPGSGEALLGVRATSVNAADYRLMRADPFLARLDNGLFRPKKRLILGSDVASVVERVGDNVQHVNVGDEVFGDAFQDRFGAFAEYVCVRESALISKPENVSFEEAAAVPLAGVTALQGLRDLGQVQSGQAVLVQGAGGGVGISVVQIAKALGAEVTAVCSAGSAEMVRGFGADRVMDYAEEDFTKEDKRYDVILGVNGHHSLAEYKRCLNPGGRYVMIGGSNRQIFEALLLGRLTFMLGNKTSSVLTIDGSLRAKDLAQLRDMLTSGELKPVIDRTFGLNDTAEAIRYVEKGHVRGKVVITVAA